MKNKKILKFVGKKIMVFSVGASLLASPLSNITVGAIPYITTDEIFESLEKTSRITGYNSDRDRYNNIGSTSAPRSKRLSSPEEYASKHEDETCFAEPKKKYIKSSNDATEYITNGGKEVNASKVFKSTDKEGNKFSIIATQCPFYEKGRNTLPGFWDLLYTGEHVDGIIALGKGAKYIPGENMPAIMDYWSEGSTTDSMNGEYSIRREKMEPLCTASKTNITISKDEKGKTIEHYNYAEWPDRQLPTDKDAFEDFVKQFVGKRKLVVHCSAGIGRTGVFAACLYALKTGSTDPVKIVNEMRSYRSGMVQTKEQFDYICKFIARNCMGLESGPDWEENINYLQYFKMSTEQVLDWIHDKHRSFDASELNIDSDVKTGEKFSLKFVDTPKFEKRDLGGFGLGRWRPRFFGAGCTDFKFEEKKYSEESIINFLKLLFEDEDADGVAVLNMPTTSLAESMCLSFDSQGEKYWDPGVQLNFSDSPYTVTKNPVGSENPQIKETMITISKDGKQKNIDHYYYDSSCEDSWDTNFETFIKKFEKKKRLIIHQDKEENYYEKSVFVACLYALKTNCTDPIEAITKAHCEIPERGAFDFICKFIARNCVDLDSKKLTAPDWEEEIDYNAYFG